MFLVLKKKKGWHSCENKKQKNIVAFFVQNLEAEQFQ